MIKMQVLTYMVGDGSEFNPFVWKLFVDFPDLKIIDATHKSGLELISEPNVYVVDVFCTEAQYDRVYDSPDYGEGAILWSEVI